MNKDRRKQIITLRTRIEAVKSSLAELRQDIETIRDEEQVYYDTMPETQQSGEKGAAADEVISHLDAAMEAIDEIESPLDEADASLESAAA